MRAEIAFTSEGIACRGWLYLPGGGARGSRPPVVVMAHGFAAVKEMGLDRFAEAFMAAGLASLVFDYRGLGASDGEPRQDVDPQAQVADYRNAISFVRRRPEIDPERIGVWGTSYSGGHALMVAALDRRVRAAVAQVALIDGQGSLLRLGGEAGLANLAQVLLSERERLYDGGTPQTIPVVADAGGLAALASPDAVAWFRAMAPRAPAWRNEALERLLEYAPGRWIDRIAPTPLLLLVAEHDTLCPAGIAREAFARAGEPKHLCALPVGHFDLYEDPHFAVAAREATAWFTTHLAGS